MTAYDVIGWTYDGAAYCDAHRPETLEEHVDKFLVEHPMHDREAVTDTASRAQDWPAPVFASDAASFEDGGLSCDQCGYEIVDNDTCRQCDRSLRDDHDEYEYGPAVGRVHVDGVCRPGQNATILCRTSVATWSEIVPGNVTDALDAIVAAYAGRVATFDVVETETVAA